MGFVPVLLSLSLWGCRAPGAAAPLAAGEAAAQGADWASWNAAAEERRVARMELEAVKLEWERAKQRVEAMRRRLAELEGGLAADAAALREKAEALDAALSGGVN